MRPGGLIGTTNWTFPPGPVPWPPRGASDRPGGIHEATGFSEDGHGHGGNRRDRRVGAAGTSGGGPAGRHQVARLRGRHARGSREPHRRHAGVAAAAASDRHRLLQESRTELDRQPGGHPRVPGRAIRRGDPLCGVAGRRERARGRGDDPVRDARPHGGRDPTGRQSGARRSGHAREVSRVVAARAHRRHREEDLPADHQGHRQRRGEGARDLRVDRRQHLPRSEGAGLRGRRHPRDARDRQPRRQVRRSERALRGAGPRGGAARARRVRGPGGRLRGVQVPGQERRHHPSPALPRRVLHRESRLGAGRSRGRAQGRARGARRHPARRPHHQEGAGQALRPVGDELARLQLRARREAGQFQGRAGGVPDVPPGRDRGGPPTPPSPRGRRPSPEAPVYPRFTRASSCRNPARAPCTP